MARVETVRSGTASPHALRKTNDRAMLAGCVYRADGTKVALSERFSGYLGDIVRNDNADVLGVPEVRHLPGRSLYLGHFMARHYGHFITETLSTFWYFEEEPADRFSYFVFHPFIFGTDVPNYASVCLERFGVDPARLRFVGDEALRCDEIVVPERLFRLNHSADPRLGWVYQRIAAPLRSTDPATRRVYLSRRRVRAQLARRTVANEREVESLFCSHGFEVIYPESLRFADQLTIYANAAVIAGCSGSALHNSLFMRRGAMVIELGDPRYQGAPSPTQVLCNRISNVESRFIPFEGRRVAGLLIVSTGGIASALVELFGKGRRLEKRSFPMKFNVMKDFLHFAGRSVLRRIGRKLSSLRRHTQF